MDPLILNPHPSLRPYIQHYAYTDQGIDGSWNPSHLAATGCAALTFSYGNERVTLRENGNPFTHYEPLAFVAQASRFKSIYLHNRVRAFFVIFRPCGAFRLLGIRQEGMTDQCINLSDILGSSIRSLIDELSAQDQVEKLRPVMENFLLQSLLKNKMKEEGNRLSHVMEYIKRHSHINTNLITTVCQEYGYSLRSLERHMQELIGIRPKLFQRIARFNAALEYMNKKKYKCNWAQTACQFGYSDQAHFIKEFKIFYGMTPSVSTSEDPYVSKATFQKWTF